MINQKYSTFGNRFLAGLIDGLLFLPLTLVAGYVIMNDRITAWSDLAFNCIWMIYVVVGHGKYGQTIGKKLMNIKVLDKGEEKVIGYTRAFYRESIWFFLSVAAILYIVFAVDPADTTEIDKYQQWSALLTLGWFVVELVTMLTNNKRRAVHDFIAGSVVINLEKKK